jgi:hypothetical protein
MPYTTPNVIHADSGVLAVINIWAHLDSNQEPDGYEPPALTN